ncbi:MAG: AmmeMemoRadiSam system radical SAM enzyme, partial [Verrucomicrobiota bacterium]
MTQAKWWHREEDRIVCDLCPRECRLRDGQRGFCFVRQNVGGQMALTTYGRSTGFCIDPIEKKPLNHFLPGTPVLSFGTAGCNLGCKFCQNWSISKSRQTEILSKTAGPEEIAAAAAAHNCRSIAFTYNDPTIWAEYAIDSAIAAHDRGIKTVAVTAGYITPEARAAFYEHIDAANIDLKAFSDDFYRELTFSRIQPILDNLRWLKHETDVWFEITNLVIPQANDSPDELLRMSEWIVENLGPDVPVHFTAFHPDFKMQDRGRTPHETLIHARQIAIDSGIRYAYVGNVLDRERQSTYCPSCGEILIERDHYQLGTYAITDGQCSHCRAPIPGVFESQRGHWGRKRLPIQIQPTMKTEFTTTEQQAMLRFAKATVKAAVERSPIPKTCDDEVGKLPGVGMFVTLKKNGKLRACMGTFAPDGQTEPFDTLLQKAAVSTA